MALSPFKTPQSPLNRSRSSSCSSPVRNRIVYQEVFSVGANTLVRSYSCDQVFDKDESGRTLQTTQIQVSSFFTPQKKLHLQADENKPKEPRRLALQLPPEKSDAGSEKTNLTKETKHTEVTQMGCGKTMLLTFLTITSACSLYLFLSYRECKYVWDLEKTENELNENIFGQNKAVNGIKSVLNFCNRTSDVHVMVFTGGVGVGKTYSSSIISRNFPWSSNKLIAYTEHFNEDVDKLINQKFSTCGTNLVIVDDLPVKSAKEAINLIVLLNNKRKNKENVLIILIFQIFTETDRKIILSEFKNTFLNINHISFQPLSKDVVEKCFRSEIHRQGVVISDLELSHLVERKMRHIDVSKGPSGCKGVDIEVASYFKKSI